MCNVYTEKNMIFHASILTYSNNQFWKTTISSHSQVPSRWMWPEELVPGIGEEDLKTMQKPPMRSFDPAILQVLGPSRRTLVVFHEHARRWRCDIARPGSHSNQDYSQWTKNQRSLWEHFAKEPNVYRTYEAWGSSVTLEHFHGWRKQR